MLTNPYLAKFKNTTFSLKFAQTIFEKLPKVNNHPLGENSPNLVTLFMDSLCRTNTSKEEKINGEDLKK
jgi:hypothetical protein